MPELPEVELVSRALGLLIKGQRIMSAEILRARLLPDNSPEDFIAAICGGRVLSVERRGKFILVSLDNGTIWMTHLRMSGRFQLLPSDALFPKFMHAVFQMESGRQLVFSDQRHFGMMKAIPREELHEARELIKLAPEPFSKEFTPLYLAQVLARSRRTLKETLLDQTKIVGLGNIYAAEAMFRARINPFIAPAKLSRARIQKLHRAIIEVLQESIAHGSTLNIDPENIDGSYYGGDNENSWRVYDREGEPCTECRAPVHRISHAGRSTYFCQRCQRR